MDLSIGNVAPIPNQSATAYQSKRELSLLDDEMGFEIY